MHEQSTPRERYAPWLDLARRYLEHIIECAPCAELRARPCLNARKLFRDPADCPTCAALGGHNCPDAQQLGEAANSTLAAAFEEAERPRREQRQREEKEAARQSRQRAKQRKLERERVAEGER